MMAAAIVRSENGGVAIRDAAVELWVRQ